MYIGIRIDGPNGFLSYYLEYDMNLNALIQKLHQNHGIDPAGWKPDKSPYQTVMIHNTTTEDGERGPVIVEM